MGCKDRGTAAGRVLNILWAPFESGEQEVATQLPLTRHKLDRITRPDLLVSLLMLLLLL